MTRSKTTAQIILMVMQMNSHLRLRRKHLTLRLMKVYPLVTQVLKSSKSKMSKTRIEESVAIGMVIQTQDLDWKALVFSNVNGLGKQMK